MTIAVVTGAASGIGRALARQLAREGHLVYLADLAATQSLASELDGIAATVDVADADDMQRLAASAAGARIVCLNAGIVGPTAGPPWEADPSEWQHLLGVNLGGVVNGLRAFVPRLLADAEPANVIITASLAGLLSFPGGGAYAATKHAVVAVAEQAALTLARTNVMVTVICPALVRTGMSEIGAEPAVVAAEALAAARSGRFLVVPREWSAAIMDRAETVLSGSVPRAPEPAAAPVTATPASTSSRHRGNLPADPRPRPAPGDGASPSA